MSQRCCYVRDAPRTAKRKVHRDSTRGELWSRSHGSAWTMQPSGQASRGLICVEERIGKPVEEVVVDVIVWDSWDPKAQSSLLKLQF
jgi:hypothetical protein